MQGDTALPLGPLVQSALLVTFSVLGNSLTNHFYLKSFLGPFSVE